MFFSERNTFIISHLHGYFKRFSEFYYIFKQKIIAQK